MNAILTTPDTSPLFSVVIATFNYGHLIERAIDSVLSQTLRDFELIIVDDGSTDDTAERVAAFGPALRYLKQTNLGQSAACNAGVSVAQGRFIYVLDADDELFHDALQWFANAIGHDGADAERKLYYGGYVSVSETGEERVRYSRDAPGAPYDRLKAFLNKRLIGLKHGGFTLPRQAFERIHYAEDVKQGTDIVIIGQALAFYQAVNIGQLVLRSHEHAQRVRKQLNRILTASMRPVDALFDPRIMPAELMPLKPLYQGRRLRSIARQLYIAGHNQAAVDHYKAAFRTAPHTMFDVGSLAKMLRAMIRARRNPNINIEG